MKAKLDEVIQQLAKLQIATSDRHNSTPEILQAITKFFTSDLDVIVIDLKEIRDEIEESEDETEDNPLGEDELPF